MGWERKRGKIEEFNRLLRGATRHELRRAVGRPVDPADVRYCITLDSDTRLPRDAAQRADRHRRCTRSTARASIARRGGVTEGYGILQPRVSVTMASAAGSLFARVYAGHTGVDPYTTAVSDTYQDLFGEGIFTGKGLYDVDAFTAALEGRVPENALLSHDLFEGLYARVGARLRRRGRRRLSREVLAHARRQHRWVRGDWQILLWLFPWVPTRHGLERNRLPLISRWKILDNLRRSLVAAGAARAARAPAGRSCRARRWSGRAGGRWPCVAARCSTLLRCSRARRAPQQPLRVFLRGVSARTLRTAARAGAAARSCCSPYHAWRDGARDRRSRWSAWSSRSGACSSGRPRPASPRARSAWTAAAALRRFVAEMAASPLVALALLAAVAAVAAAALAAALPFLRCGSRRRASRTG